MLDVPCVLLQIVGALHHGKTTLMDMLVEQTHDVPSLGIRTGGRQLRFTDTRVDEQVGLPWTSSSVGPSPWQLGAT